MTSQIKNLIDSSNSILILTHEKPDGDAIGSVLAFYNYLGSIDKSVDMVISDVPKIFNFLPSIDRVVDTPLQEYDLGIIVDCATQKRIGQTEDLFSRCKKTISIDHHISNSNYCDVNFVKGSISSCCEVIYYLFNDLNINITKDMGICLISGVITDTNGFCTDNVTDNTFKLAGEIFNLGIDIHDIYNRVLLKKSMSQHQLIKIAVERLEFLCDGKIAFTYILKKDMDLVNAKSGDHEGIVNIGRNIDGVEVSVFIREEDGFTISLRSTGLIDVNKIAEVFNGGGHFMAAGAKTRLSFKETKQIIIDEIKKVI